MENGRIAEQRNHKPLIKTQDAHSAPPPQFESAEQELHWAQPIQATPDHTI